MCRIRIEVDPIGIHSEIWEVDAWCAGGKYGNFAVFQHPKIKDRVCYANGDDGYWWFIKAVHCRCLPEHIIAMQKALRTWS